MESTKGQKIFGNLLGFLTDAPFGTDEVFNQIADAHNAYYLVEQEGKQIMVTVTEDFIESKVNIGFIDICGVPCFLFACNNDIKEKGKIDGKKKSKVYKIKNIHFIPLNKYLNVNAIYKVENEG